MSKRKPKKSIKKLPEKIVYRMQPLAYNLSIIDKEKYIKFPTEVAFPLDIIELILKACKKAKLKKGAILSSFFLPLPKGLKLKSGSFIAKNPNFKNGKETKETKKAH